MSSLRIGALFSFTLTLSLTSQSVVCGDPAKPCNPDICKLPDCFCSGTEIPGNLPASSIPQIVFISFDGAFNNDLYDPDDLKDFFNDDGLKTLKNPNGCNISVTFFLSHFYTNYCAVQDLYSQRHEIAVNSISRRLPKSWWANATVKEQTQEIGGMRRLLQKMAHVKAEDVKGYRAPYMQVGGNTEFKVLKDLGFLYESSMPTRNFIDQPLWPYTLDYRSTQGCEIQPCPTGMGSVVLEAREICTKLT